MDEKDVVRMKKSLYRLKNGDKVKKIGNLIFIEKSVVDRLYEEALRKEPQVAGLTPEKMSKFDKLMKEGREREEEIRRKATIEQFGFDANAERPCGSLSQHERELLARANMDYKSDNYLYVNLCQDCIDKGAKGLWGNLLPGTKCREKEIIGAMQVRCMECGKLVQKAKRVSFECPEGSGDVTFDLGESRSRMDTVRRR